ncbi:unnamed protein product [Camellia sinensis]
MTDDLQIISLSVDLDVLIIAQLLLEQLIPFFALDVRRAKLSMSEIKAIINEFRSRHLSELTELSEASGGSLGYEYSRIMSKPKSQLSNSSDDNQIIEGTLVI